MDFGAWDINVTVDAMPEQIATAFAKLSILKGAEYTPIAYLGSQVANGIKHAVLAEQTLITGKDQKNIVLVIFRQVGDDVELPYIERVLESGGECGGVKVDVKVPTPPEAVAVLDKALSSYVGLDAKPFALLGTQVVKGVNYFIACEVTPVVKGGAPSEIAMIMVNPLSSDIDYTVII